MNIFKNPKNFLVVDAALSEIIASCSKSVGASVDTEAIDVAKIFGYIYRATIFESRPTPSLY